MARFHRGEVGRIPAQIEATFPGTHSRFSYTGPNPRDEGCEKSSGPYPVIGVEALGKDPESGSLDDAIADDSTDPPEVADAPQLVSRWMM